MPKRLSLSLSLLTSVILAGVPAQAATPTAPTVSQQQPTTTQIISPIAAEQQATPQAALTLEDLPPGFTELPPEVATTIASRLDVLRQQLGQNSLQPENFFAFVNQQNFQIVLGFTGKLPNQSEQASFDANLQQQQKPEVQQMMLSQLQEKLKEFGGLKVTEYTALPELNNLANASTGLTMAMEMQGQPLRVDFAAFRRNNVGAFTAVMYPTNGGQPTAAIGDVAQKLDARILQLSADANRSPVARRGSSVQPR